MAKSALDTSLIRNRLKLRNLEAQARFASKHPHAHAFFKSVGLDPGKIRRHSAKLLATGALGGALLLPAPVPSGTGPAGDGLVPGKPDGQIQSVRPLILPAPVVEALSSAEYVVPGDPQEWLVNQLSKILPPIHSRWGLPLLTYDEERVTGRLIQRVTGVAATASLEGEHLNTVYGYMGSEQHLRRFPGDTLAKHDMQGEGMAPGLSAWGHFTEGGRVTQDAILREKYYVAVQTLYLPDWEKRFKYLRDWYKWRKVVVVDVDYGTSVVAVIGDAGPASWTGKHFGGSPEVMYALGGPNYKKGRVLLYFIDDPGNKVSLGPIDYSKINVPVVEAI